MEDAILENPVAEKEENTAPAYEAQVMSEAASDAPAADENTAADPDYEALASADLSELKEQFPALSALTSLTELPEPIRYAELRELGLSPREAYLATGGAVRKKSDNRSHLFSAVPRTSTLGRDLPTSEQMAEARRLFSDLSDEQIYRLYKKVTI